MAGCQKVDALKAGTAFTIDDLKKTLEWEKTDIQPGDAVFVRAGTLRSWGKGGSNHERIRGHDTAGINLDSARWLVEQKGAILIDSDTSGLEVWLLLLPVAPAPSHCKNIYWCSRESILGSFIS